MIELVLAGAVAAISIGGITLLVTSSWSTSRRDLDPDRERSA